MTKKKLEVILGSIEGQGLPFKGVHPRIAQTNLEKGDKHGEISLEPRGCQGSQLRHE